MSFEELFTDGHTHGLMTHKMWSQRLTLSLLDRSAKKPGKLKVSKPCPTKIYQGTQKLWNAQNLITKWWKGNNPKQGWESYSWNWFSPYFDQASFNINKQGLSISYNIAYTPSKDQTAPLRRPISLCSPHENNLNPWLPWEDSDQTARMRRQIYVFLGRSCNFAVNVVPRLTANRFGGMVRIGLNSHTTEWEIV